MRNTLQRSPLPPRTIGLVSISVSFRSVPLKTMAIVLLMCTLMLSNVACTVSQRPSQTSDVASDVTLDESPPKPSQAPPLSSSPVSLPSDVEATILGAIAQDLGQPETNLTIEEATSQTWSDGCLGLAEPGEFCTMALVDGWQLRVTDQQSTMTYRSNEAGTVVRQAK